MRGEGFGEVGSVNVEVVRMTTDVVLPSGKGIRGQMLGGYGVTIILLEVGGFDMLYLV